MMTSMCGPMTKSLLRVMFVILVFGLAYDVNSIDHLSFPSRDAKMRPYTTSRRLPASIQEEYSIYSYKMDHPRKMVLPIPTKKSDYCL